MIKDIHDIMQTGNESLVKSFLRRAMKPMPKETDGSFTLSAEVNHGRWVVKCPYCKGAEMVDKQDLRFYCLSCHNEKNGGKWIKVVVPSNATKIEAELEKRPLERNKNWLPNETLKSLQNENAKMKAGGL